MRVYKVSPIVKYSPFFKLTYVSKEDFSVGDIVLIDFNKREIFAVVLETYSLKDAKVEIRKADFQTKKIEKKLSETQENFLDKDLFKVLKDFSDKFLISVGELVYFIYGEDLAANPDPRGSGENIEYFPDDLSLKAQKSKIDENIFRGNKIFKEIIHNKYETLTIKDFNFDKYLEFQAPHISKLDLLFEILKVKEIFKKIILETDFLGVVEQNFLDENLFKGKLFGKIKIEVNEKNNKAKKFLVKTGRDKNGEEEILAKEAVAKISSTTSPSAKTFIFVLSHGYADRIFCNDCKKAYDCENCGGAYSVLNEEEGRFLFCKNCKHKKILQDDQYLICKHCGSWRIFPFGIGGQKVKEFLETTPDPSFKSRGIQLIDESQKKLSAKKIIGEIKNFMQSESGVLVGSLRTLHVLKGLGATLDKSFIVSTGPIVRGKYFDSDEKLLKLISEIENISKEVYINKRDGDEISLENYKDKAKFIKEEIVFRKKHNLPPATKVLSLIFNFRNKRHVDKFILQDISLFKPAGEIKKGQNFIYYWFVKRESEILETREVLRQFGDVFLANTIIEQSVLGKK